jgi:hypothetical protein
VPGLARDAALARLVGWARGVSLPVRRGMGL